MGSRLPRRKAATTPLGRETWIVIAAVFVCAVALTAIAVIPAVLLTPEEWWARAKDVLPEA